MSYTSARYREPLNPDPGPKREPEIAEDRETVRAPFAPTGAGLPRLRTQYRPVNQAAPDVAGLIARRSALFVIAYAPLSAAALLTTWPAELTGAELARLGSWVVAVTLVCAWPLARALVPTGRPRRWFGGISLLATIGAVGGLAHDWHQPASGAAATGAAAFGGCVAAAVLVVLVLLAARRPTTHVWKVRAAGDAGGAMFDYVVSWLLPAWVLWLFPTDAGWVAPAIAGNLLVAYVLFVTSQKFVLVNPTLNLLGYRLYEVVLQRPGIGMRPVVLIARGSLLPGLPVSASPVGDECYVGRRPPRSREA